MPVVHTLDSTHTPMYTPQVVDPAAFIPAASVEPDDLSTLIYTSGTTGERARLFIACSLSVCLSVCPSVCHRHPPPHPPTHPSQTPTPGTPKGVKLTPTPRTHPPTSTSTPTPSPSQHIHIIYIFPPPHPPGTPKGVKLTHRNLTADVKGMTPVIPDEAIPVARSVAFLPWAHCAWLVVFVLVYMYVCMCVYVFAPSSPGPTVRGWLFFSV